MNDCDWNLDLRWLSAPTSSDPLYQPFYSAVSYAMQTALRRLVLPLYFTSPERYQDIKLGYPLVCYAASKPFLSRLKGEFTYDVLNSENMSDFWRTARVRLPLVLASLEEGLRAGGEADLAILYRSRKALPIALRTERRTLYHKRACGLLAAETGLLSDLIAVGGNGLQPDKRQGRIVRQFMHRWITRLRRFYPNQDFSSLGPALLDEITIVAVEGKQPRDIKAAA
ncbi:MAG TPA: hypothetical protein VKU01_15590 [Bryobacteraceae bacterium]|nr:hypothetical protein [Bryobacteraceae bacterium]